MQVTSNGKDSAQRKLPPIWVWGIPLVLLVGVALFVAFGPEERTLGGGIRSVYLHVGLIWAGLFGFGVTAVLGIGVLLTKKLAWQRWLATVSWVALGFYAAGIFMSMVASADNWGAVFLQEPRMAASLSGATSIQLTFLTVTVLFVLLATWLVWFLRQRTA